MQSNNGLNNQITTKNPKTYIGVPLWNCKEWGKDFREKLNSFCRSSVLSIEHLN